MAKPRDHLSKAPAREALIDIEFVKQVELTTIDAFVAGVDTGFSDRLDLVETSLGIGPAGATTTQPITIIGRRLDNKVTHFVLQVRRNGFTLSRLSPYGEWAELRAETQKWWSKFSETVGDPIAISRITVRYINELDLPLNDGGFDAFLTSTPAVPAELPQAVGAFLQRVTIPVADSRCTAVVTQVMEGGRTGADEGSRVPVLLDIEVFRVVVAQGCSDGELWSCLDDLRSVKNRIFFAYLTEKAVEMFA